MNPVKKWPSQNLAPAAALFCMYFASLLCRCEGRFGFIFQSNLFGPHMKTAIFAFFREYVISRGVVIIISRLLIRRVGGGIYSISLLGRRRMAADPITARVTVTCITAFLICCLSTANLFFHSFSYVHSAKFCMQSVNWSEKMTQLQENI